MKEILLKELERLQNELINSEQKLIKCEQDLNILQNNFYQKKGEYTSIFNLAIKYGYVDENGNILNNSN